MSEEDHNPMDDVDLTDVYAASSGVGAERIVLLLQAEGVEAEARESSVAGFPAAGTQSHLVIVPANQREQARALIKKAVEDGVLPGDGSFL